MNKFEAVLIISPEVSNNLLEQNIKKFQDIVTKSSGKITNTEDWGLRDLSYKIDQYSKAFYNFYQIEIDGDKLEGIKKTLNQDENFIRYLFVKVENHQELPTKLNNEKK